MKRFGGLQGVPEARGNFLCWHLSDGFTFWSCYVLVFYEDFGSSWRVEADFDGSFTFLSCFGGLRGIPEARGKKNSWLLEPKIRQTVAQKLQKNGIKKWTNFWPVFSDFLASCESISGAILGSEQVKKRQHGPKKDLKSFKVPKNSICKKCDFPNVKPYFSSLGGLSRRA